MTVAKDADMGIRQGLAARVRAEYREMPGLSLTAEQASRLWGLNLSVSAPTSPRRRLANDGRHVTVALDMSGE